MFGFMTGWRLGRMERQIEDILHALGENGMVRQSFDELKAHLEHSATVQTSAVELLKDLADRISDIANHPSAQEISALATEVRQHADALAGAIAKHAGDDDEEAQPMGRKR